MACSGPGQCTDLASRAPRRGLLALQVATALTCDGKLDEPAWRQAPSSGRFVDATTGELIPPHAEARALWDERALYLALYAADEDIETFDRMGVVVALPAPLVIAIDPAGTVHLHRADAADEPLPAGLLGAVERDGSLDDASDDDEEWTAELSVPWPVLQRTSPADLNVNFFRTDQPKHFAPRTLVWHASPGGKIGADGFAPLLLARGASD